jgi:hypothetical protein
MAYCSRIASNKGEEPHAAGLELQEIISGV